MDLECLKAWLITTDGFSGPGARFTKYLMIYRKIIVMLGYSKIKLRIYNMLKIFLRQVVS